MPACPTAQPIRMKITTPMIESMHGVNCGGGEGGGQSAAAGAAAAQRSFGARRPTTPSNVPSVAGGLPLLALELIVSAVPLMRRGRPPRAPSSGEPFSLAFLRDSGSSDFSNSRTRRSQFRAHPRRSSSKVDPLEGGPPMSRRGVPGILESRALVAATPLRAQTGTNQAVMFSISIDLPRSAPYFYESVPREGDRAGVLQSRNITGP